MSLEFTTVEKRIPLDSLDIIIFQLSTYCFINKIMMSHNQMKTLAYLGKWGEMNISDFCQQISDEGIYSNPQTVRNFLLKCIESGTVIRKGTGKKIIELSEKIDLITEGNILLRLKVYHVDPKIS